MRNFVNALFYNLKLTNIREVGKNIYITRNDRLIIKNKLKIFTGSQLIANTGNLLIGGGRICEYAKINTCEGVIKIGDNVQIGDYCFITGRGGITIGQNVLFASFVSLIAEDHMYDDVNTSIIMQKIKPGSISIGDDCWFGIKSTVLSNTTIGEHCIIGANSVVRGVFPSYSVIAGCPARVIKRFDKKVKKWINVDEKHS